VRNTNFGHQLPSHRVFYPRVHTWGVGGQGAGGGGGRIGVLVGGGGCVCGRGEYIYHKKVLLLDVSW
jgi:hypothetical protein